MKYRIVLALLLVSLLGVHSALAIPQTARKKVEKILKQKCMDCHSDQTVYPWYANLPLVHDLIQADVTKGRSYLDLEKELFSVRKEKNIPKHVIVELESVITADAMPPIQYRAIHWDKVITKEDKLVILDWLDELKGLVIEPIPTKDSLILDQGKVLLGEKLFHDKRLSADNSISCATCHDLAKGGTDQMRFSTGINGTKGHINSPTVYNSIYNIKQFWDGRADDLVAQASGPVHNPAEMGSSWEEVISKMQDDKELLEMFKTSFGVKSSKEITGEMIASAIAEHEKSLITPGSRFDQFLNGNRDAINAEERQGFELFKKYNCTNCHLGPAVGGGSFEKMGLARDYFADRTAGLNGLKKMAASKEDNGRYNFNHKEDYRYKFKVPILRNIELTYPYFHDGNVASLDEAVRIMAEYQVGKKPTKREIELIVKFLKTLTGEGLKQS
jgi:cytochrome c peroxidase